MIKQYEIKSKWWLITWIVLVLVPLFTIGYKVYKIDPYVHFHKPLVNVYYYDLGGTERYVNDGIIKNFDYDALITGTCLTENFKTSEMDSLFGTNSIKVPFSGATYKELGDNVRKALIVNPNLKTVLRCLDMGGFMAPADGMLYEADLYPEYLYDNNPLNDIKYLYNKDVIVEEIYQMITNNNKDGFQPGIISFDDYCRWQKSSKYGVNACRPNGIAIKDNIEEKTLSEDDKNTIHDTITKNVISFAEEYPNTTFIYYLSPYSAGWWANVINEGGFKRQIEAERIVIEMLLEYDNIQLHSFNNRLDVTTDFNNYIEDVHYGLWMNSLILKWIASGEYLLTKDNYLQYLADEEDNYSKLDYMALNYQCDYEDDYYAEALSNSEIYNIQPCAIDEIQGIKSEFVDINNIWEKGYIPNANFYGTKRLIGDIGTYNYIVFECKKNMVNDMPMMCKEMDDEYTVISLNEYENDDSFHQYVLDISDDKNKGVIYYFNKGYIDNSGNEIDVYDYRNIMLY